MKEVLTFTETYEYLRISKGTLIKLIKDKVLKSKKVGVQHRFIKKDLEEYLKNNNEK